MCDDKMTWPTSFSLVDTLVQWWCHLIMLWHQHMVTGPKLTHQSMNLMIALVIQYPLCVLPVVMIRHFSGKFDHHLSLYCCSIKPKFKTGAGYWFLWESGSYDFQNLITILAQFLQYTFKNNSNCPIEKKIWRKMAHPVCLKPVSMERCLLDSLWRFTVYQC